MNSEELLKLLDLKGTQSDPQPVSTLFPSKSKSSATTHSSTALVIDSWGCRRGKELLGESPRLQQLGLDEFAVSDCHAAAFDPDPQLVPACSDPFRYEFFKALLESPDYRALHEVTRVDVAASEIATHRFAEQLHQFQNEAKTSSDLDPEISALRSAGQAVLDAKGDVLKCREVSLALGMGPGGAGTNDPKTIADLFRRVRKDPQLEAICALAGRYRRLAQSRQRRKTSHGLDDVIGIELGATLGNALPLELAKLAIPEFETNQLRRLVEGQWMGRAYSASEPIGKGPILVVVDESGSMAGDPIHRAKAIALALAWIARRQHRWCGLCAYSGNSGERLLTLPPHRWDESALAEWLSAFIGYGSTLDVPVREMPRIYRDMKAPTGATDLIFLTDCCCHIPSELGESFVKWKQSVTARLITLVMGEEPGDLKTISDELHLVPFLGIEESAVERILSI